MPSTFFTEPPHWRWLIVLYFFLGGIAGGCYFLAALIDLFGRPTDRPLARLGYRIAFPTVAVCGVLLIVDLGRPERFWHMLLQSETWLPMFKSYSPMSFGAWGLLAFSAFAFLSFVATFRDNHRHRPVSRLRPPGVIGTIIAFLGGLSGFFLASYTGVLLAVTNRPIWSDTSLLGLVFVVSSASTSIALLLLLGSRRVFLIGGLRALQRFDIAVRVLELITLVALIASLGSLARVWLNQWGALLALGVVGLGIIVPLLLHLRTHGPTTGAAKLAAALVLVGGFLLRVVIVLSAESI
jgi:formate-dependent nitrite reductase membrane component NrfD